MRRYIDEYLEPPNRQWLIHTFESIKSEAKDLHFNQKKTIDEVVEYFIEKLYIFRDDEERAWEKKVIEDMINDREVTNRFTKITFK